MAKILIVDDEQQVLNALRRALGARHEISTVLGTEAVSGTLEQESPFDVVISDFRMPGDLTGADVLHLARRYHPTVGCILHSGGAPRGLALADIVRDHCPPGTMLIEKPASPNELDAVVNRVMPRG